MSMDYFQEDLNTICATDYIPWEQLQNKTLLVTGGTGLIGMTLIHAIANANQTRNLCCRVLALVRDEAKAKKILGTAAELIVGDVVNLPEITSKVDLIIHAACPTASSFMVSNPVEVIEASVLGTINLLKRAVRDYAKFIYLSSMEAYGKVTTEEPLDENVLGFINPLTIRSCYPESKRMCEAIVAAYAKEYDVQAVSVRLAQTFGPGILADDKRVFAMMARCALQKENIKLLTKGESRHPYLYTADAVTAVLTILLKGEKGQSYNAANPETYCSIYEMGTMVATEIAGGKIEVLVSENGDATKYPDTSYLNLDVSLLRALGWRYTYGLRDMYIRMIKSTWAE